mgnify:CR=1 FL=1
MAELPKKNNVSEVGAEMATYFLVKRFDEATKCKEKNKK